MGESQFAIFGAGALILRTCAASHCAIGRVEPRVRHEPFGVAGAITSWNAPFCANIVKTMHLLATSA